jgi:hypothetical protein
MSKKKVILIILSVVILFVIVYILRISNFTRIIDNNIEIASKTKGYLYLSEVTPFDWDKAFFIEDPYIGGDALDKIVGVECNLKRTETEAIRRIVFIKDKKFVYDYHYQWTNIIFSPLGIVADRENCKFMVEKSNISRLLLKRSE